MNQHDQSDDPRRRQLLQALAAGFFSGLPITSALAGPFGDIPRQLPPGRSIYRLSGQVLVNGKPADTATRIGPRDTIETAAGAEIVFAVGADAYILRGGSKLVLSTQRGDSEIASLLRILAGKVLAVFGRGVHDIETPTATLGVRGTGVYVESDPEQTYLCTCYGIAALAARNDRDSRETIESKHHDQPRYILNQAAAGKYIRPAPFINHTDVELMLIEALVGRTPPFAFPSDDYTAPRRGY
jgi:hypothetical protein